MNRERQAWDRKLKSKILGLERWRSRFCKCNDTFPPCRLREEEVSAEFCGPHLRWGAHKHNHVWRVQNGEWRSCWGLTAKTPPASCAFTEAAPQPSSGPPGTVRCWPGLLISEVVPVFCFPNPQFSMLFFQRLGPATSLTIWCLQWMFSFLLHFLFWLVKVSLVHESFLDLSLPVLDDQVRPLVHFI